MNEAKQEPRLWQEGDDLTIAWLAGYGKAQERIAELEAVGMMLDTDKRRMEEYINKLEAVLDVALVALERLQGIVDTKKGGEAIAKIKKVRKCS